MKTKRVSVGDDEQIVVTTKRPKLTLVKPKRDCESGCGRKVEKNNDGVTGTFCKHCRDRWQRIIVPEALRTFDIKISNGSKAPSVLVKLVTDGKLKGPKLLNGMMRAALGYMKELP